MLIPERTTGATPLGAGITARVHLEVDLTDLGAHLAHSSSVDQATVLSGFALGLADMAHLPRGLQVTYLARELQHGAHRDRLPEVVALLDDLRAMLGPPPGLG